MAFGEDFFNIEIEIGTDESILETQEEKEIVPNELEKDKDITEVTPENLFSEEPEEVGDEDKIESEDEASKDKTVSPKTSIYSSFANALQEDNVLTTINSEDVTAVKTADDFAELIKKEVANQLDEKQRRITEALESGVEPTVVKSYENAITYLDSLSEEVVSDESDKGISVRKNLILQDFLNRGFSRERAEREVKKSFDAGTDIEDAKDSLEANKEHFKTKYQEILDEAKEDAEADKKEAQKVRTKLQELLTGKNDPFEGVVLDKAARQKVYDTISKPIYTDEDGNKYTAVQKYEKENKADFMYKLGVLFHLTDGFKNVDKLVKGKVNKEVKNSLKEVEATLQGKSLNMGSLSLLGGDEPDTESNSGLTLNV